MSSMNSPTNGYKYHHKNNRRSLHKDKIQCSNGRKSEDSIKPNLHLKRKRYATQVE